MENLKFNVGDNVKIVSNDLQPAMVGKIGRVKKVYPSFSEDSDIERLQRKKITSLIRKSWPDNKKEVYVDEE